MAVAVQCRMHLELLLDLVHHKVRHLVAQRAVAVIHAEERLLVLGRLGAIWVDDAAAVLVNLRRGLARAHARLDAVARVGADILEGKGRVAFGLTTPISGSSTCGAALALSGRLRGTLLGLLKLGGVDVGDGETARAEILLGFALCGLLPENSNQMEERKEASEELIKL